MEFYDASSARPELDGELEADIETWRAREDAHRLGAGGGVIDSKTRQMLHNLGSVE